MSDPTERAALVERLLMKAAHDENYWDRGECVALLREAADALAADEALRAENEALRAVLLSNEHIEKNTLRTSWQEAEAERDAALAAAENCECPHDPDGTCAAPREIAAAEARAVAAEERIEAVRALPERVFGDPLGQETYQFRVGYNAALNAVRAALGAPLDTKEAQR